MAETINIRNVTQLDDVVYIGRPGNGRSGFFGSPIVIGKPCPICNKKHRKAGTTLPCFEAYARHRIAADPIYRKGVATLIGRTLGCFCKPGPCHGDVLSQLADELTLADPSPWDRY